jgi:ankyrin repeat protein
MNRKAFLQNGILLGGSIAITPFSSFGSSDNDLFTNEEIREFVFAAHMDFEKTKKILDEKPLILNCTNQSVQGDFETAIGGSSHMGRRDITDLLVSKGARLDIFNLTFLGYADIIKELIKVNPHYLNAYGPHGFTLLHHANVGNHSELAEWLEDKGLKETRFMNIFTK